jgi:hypothetical protein
VVPDDNARGLRWRRMRWWLKVRRAHWVPAASLALYLLLMLAAHDTVISLPSLATGTVQARLGLFAPLTVVLGLALCLDSRLEAPEASGVRATTRLDMGLSLLLACSAMGLSLLAWSFVGSAELVSYGRNSLFLIGLLLIVLPLMREAAALIPAAWLLLVMLVGFRSPLDPYPWTVVPEPVGAYHAWAGSVLVFSAGIVCQLLIKRRIS